MPHSFNKIWIHAIWSTKERMRLIHSIAEVIQQIKGTSSHFINQNNLIPEKFAWQTG